jgi:hypothetical protein
LNGTLGERAACGFDDAEIGDCGFTNPIDFSEAGGGCRQDFGYGTEFRDELFRKSFHVSLGDRAKEQELDQFVIGEAIGPTFSKTRAQALAMAAAMVDGFWPFVILRVAHAPSG